MIFLDGSPNFSREDIQAGAYFPIITAICTSGK
jgi:hypothetical protein